MKRCQILDLKLISFQKRKTLFSSYKGDNLEIETEIKKNEN